jgi:uncharacterized protein YggE
MDTLFSYRYMRVLVALLIATIIAAVALMAAQSFNWLIDDDFASINVEGVAEVVAVPDIGVFSFMVETEAADVAAAQSDATNAMNSIMAYLRDEGGVAENDIKTTGYNASPRYEWRATELCITGNCPRERVTVGYVVTQNVNVKVRDTEQAGTLIGGVGQRGATNMSGLSFEVDDLEAVKEEARLLAIADAKAQAERIADELDVRLGDILNYSDGGGGGFPMPYATRGAMDMMAVDEMAFAEPVIPDIAVGEDTITARVTITYEIK